MSPPKLARNAPRLDVLHPIEIGFFPILGHEICLALTHCRNGGTRQFFNIDVPLVSEERLDHHIRAVAMWDHVSIRFDLFDEACRFQSLDDLLACDETILAMQCQSLFEFG